MTTARKTCLLPACAALALAIGCLPCAYPQARSAPPAAGVFQPTVEVAHYWNSASERKAFNIYRDAWKAQGGKWFDRTSWRK